MKLLSFESILFSALMSVIMSASMSLAILMIDLGVSFDVFQVWPERWAYSLVIALPTAVVASIAINFSITAFKRAFLNKQGDV
jgi:hypothetical protein